MSVYVEQTGYTVSFDFVVNGDANTPKPSRLSYQKPGFRGRTVSGIPKHQGGHGLTVEYDTMTIEEFPFFAVAFFPGLNSGEGPTVTVYWPNPYEAGRFVTADGMLMWPEWGQWEKGLLHGCKMEITSLKQRPD